MKLEDQLCSLELAKKLKELDVKQDSLFCWGTEFDLEFLPTEIRNENVVVAAFTVSELGKMLPWVINEKFHFQNIKSGYDWLIAYVEHDSLPPLICIIDDSEANCRAKMLIWLIENGYVKNEK